MSLLFYNAKVITQQKLTSEADAFMVRNGCFEAVGSYDDVFRKADRYTRHINLRGATVLPGFNDCHVHLWKVGNLKTYLLDLRGVRSIGELQAMLSDYATQYPDLPWIQARGYNEALFEEGRPPTLADLDAAVPDRPVCVMRTCAHQIVVNTAALEACQIPPGTTIAGGEIRLLPDGQLSGHFTETAIGLVLNKIPPYSAAEYRDMVLAAQQLCFKLGITSATDPAVMPDLLAVYRQMEAQGDLLLRVNAFPIRIPDGGNEELPLPERFESDRLTVNTVKFFSDGGLSGQTAAMKKAYLGSKNKGVLRLEAAQFKRLAQEAVDAGFGVATHAIGDAAMKFVLDTYKTLGDVPGLRLEHVGLPDDADIRLMAQMGIGAAVQPIFMHELGRNFRQSLDPKRLERTYPIRSLLHGGVKVGLSTDAPVVRHLDPFMNILSACLRSDTDGVVIGADERLTLDEALYAYTMGSSEVQGTANRVGDIRAGHAADFVVLDGIFALDSLPDCRVVATYVGGEKVYERC